MTLGQEYNLKRSNFIFKTLKHFDYLITDFNYSGPEISFGKQENGTIISDKIFYYNKEKDRAVGISNSYHPVDYGFEIKLYRNLTGETYSESKMVLYMLKEKQDTEQDYILNLAKELVDSYSDILNGLSWLD